MAKNKKKASQTAEIDIGQMLLDDMQVEVAQPAPQTKKEDEDEFEALLRSFISESKEDKKAGDVSEDDLPEAENIASNPSLRQQIAGLNLGNDESELALAYANFIDAIEAIAKENQLPLPEFFFEAESLVPNYKPSTGRRIVADALTCWDILLLAYPDKLVSLQPSASDEEFLNFAEGISDQNLQQAIISYVEILIDIENCEISYEEKRLKAQRRRIERQLYEEYQRRQEIRRKFIESIQKKGFPVNAERLIGNYFKTAAKDPEGSFKILTNNPAVYAPIEINKIKPRFFGLIKASPKDGIRENHRLGEFLKKLKV